MPFEPDTARGSDPPPSQDYVRALRFSALTRFYDPLIGAIMPEAGLRRRLIDQASIGAGHRVLDLGCGTGTLAIAIKRAAPDSEVIGLDGDGEVLGRAARKAREAGVPIDLRRGLAEDPPFPDRSFDRIVSSLVFHHLTTAQKRQALSHCRRMLRPGGQIHVVDWGQPTNAALRLAFLPVRLLDGFATTADSARGRLPGLMREAGLVAVQETGRKATLLGTLRFFRGDGDRPQGLHSPTDCGRQAPAPAERGLPRLSSP